MITLLTPTGERPEAFALCEKWMARQTYQGEIQWLVADDGAVETPCTMGQTVIRPAQKWLPGMNTQFSNILALLPLVRSDKILIVEDDDWYSPRYLEITARRLDEAVMVGEAPSLYYNVRYSSFVNCPNTRHASLFQTAFRGEVVPVLARICQQQAWIDLALWPAVRGGKLYRSAEAVGIKGMPGRPGQVTQHRIDPTSGLSPDPTMAVLRQWIGAEDAAMYRRFAG